MDNGRRYKLRQCPECKEWFYPTGSKVKYCSDPCRTEAKKRTNREWSQRTNGERALAGKVYTCEVCTREFTPLNGQHVKYCGKVCREFAHREQAKLQARGERNKWISVAARMQPLPPPPPVPTIDDGLELDRAVLQWAVDWMKANL